MAADKSQTFDVVVIGGGPGGYPAAIRAAQNGASVALVEGKDLGGTCLNRGCIPTKTLITHAAVLERVREAEEFGISVGPVSFEYSKMTARKDAIVNKIRSGLGGLLASNKITIIKGHGQLTSPHEVKVTGEDAGRIEAKSIIIATGSEPLNISAFPFDGEHVHSSTSVLNLTELPKRMAIIGAGVIGCEFASLFSSMEVEVSLLEMLPTIVATEAPKVSSALANTFTKRGMAIHTNVMVESITKGSSGITVNLAGGDTVDADMALVAVGRKLNSDNIGLDVAGVVTGKKGEILVDSKMATNVPGIYAIGDVTGIAMLAHVATHQGLIAADNATGKEAHIHYDAIPNVIYTDPEIASVGKTLEQAIEEGISATIGAFPFQALGKSQTSRHVEGFAQVVVDKKSGKILGAQVVGYEAGTLIAEMTLAVQNELTMECLTETMHAHPTIAEAWLEAGLKAQETPLHLPPAKVRISRKKTKG